MVLYVRQCIPESLHARSLSTELPAPSGTRGLPSWARFLGPGSEPPLLEWVDREIVARISLGDGRSGDATIGRTALSSTRTHACSQRPSR